MKNSPEELEEAASTPTPRQVAADVKEDRRRPVSRQNAAVIAQHGKRADGIVQSDDATRLGRHGPSEATASRRQRSSSRNTSTWPITANERRCPTSTWRSSETWAPRWARRDGPRRRSAGCCLNLLGNAFDAVHEHATTVNGAYTYAHRDGLDAGVRRRWIIRVSDNGPGIPAGDPEKIFEPFFTTKPTRSSRAGRSCRTTTRRCSSPTRG